MPSGAISSTIAGPRSRLRSGLYAWTPRIWSNAHWSDHKVATAIPKILRQAMGAHFRSHRAGKWYSRPGTMNFANKEPGRIRPFGTEALEEAVSLIRRSLPVAVATETVYGLAADATDGGAVARIS